MADENEKVYEEVLDSKLSAGTKATVLHALKTLEEKKEDTSGETAQYATPDDMIIIDENLAKELGKKPAKFKREVLPDGSEKITILEDDSSETSTKK